jgi:hypothetical protein
MQPHEFNADVLKRVLTARNLDYEPTVHDLDRVCKTVALTIGTVQEFQPMESGFYEIVTSAMRARI